MFATDSISLNNAIRNIVKTPTDQGRIVAAAVAQAVAARAPLPSTQLEEGGIGSFYATNVAPYVNEAISAFGEATLFATKTSAEWAQSFWKMRYFAAHPAACPLTLNSYHRSLECADAISKYDLVTLFAGGSLVLTEEVYNFINQYKAEIISLAFEFSNILDKQTVTQNGEVAING